jgi:hypothetical protein
VEDGRVGGQPRAELVRDGAGVDGEGEPEVWGTDIPRVHQKDKRPHERPVGPIIHEVIPSWAWEERPIRRIDTRLDRRRPRQPDGFEQ